MANLPTQTQTTNSSTQDQGVAVVDIWTFTVEPVDLTGFAVEATDGGIGKVDEATNESGSGHLIVDTGPWIFGKKVMLPAGVVERIDPDEKTVFVSATKDEIKGAPEFDDSSSREDKDYRERLGRHYGDRRRTSTH